MPQTEGLAGGGRGAVRVQQRADGGGGRPVRRPGQGGHDGRRPDRDAADHGHQRRDAAADVAARRVPADAAARLSAAAVSSAAAAAVVGYDGPGHDDRRSSRRPARRVQRLHAAGVRSQFAGVRRAAAAAAAGRRHHGARAAGVPERFHHASESPR